MSDQYDCSNVPLAGLAVDEFSYDRVLCRSAFSALEKCQVYIYKIEGAILLIPSLYSQQHGTRVSPVED